MGTRNTKFRILEISGYYRDKYNHKIQMKKMKEAKFPHWKEVLLIHLESKPKSKPQTEYLYFYITMLH